MVQGSISVKPQIEDDAVSKCFLVSNYSMGILLKALLPNNYLLETE